MLLRVCTGKLLRVMAPLPAKLLLILIWLYGVPRRSPHERLGRARHRGVLMPSCRAAVPCS